MRGRTRLGAGIVVLMMAATITLQPLCGKTKTTQWDTQINAGRSALKSGDYAEARRNLQMALDSTKLFQSNDPRLAETYHSLGELYLGDQEYDKAKEYFNRAMMVEQMIPGYDEQKLADTVFGLATASEMLGDSQMAVVLLKRVRDIWTKLHGSSNAKLISVLKPLGIYATVNGDFKLAESCYKELISIQERTAAGNAAVGASLNLLAATLTKENKLDEASATVERAVALLGNGGGSESNSIVAESARENLAYINQELGKPAPGATQIAANPTPAKDQPVTRAPNVPSGSLMAGKPGADETPAAEPPKTETKPTAVAAEPPKAETKPTAIAAAPATTKKVLPAPSTSAVTTSTEFRPWEVASKPADSSQSAQNSNWGKIRYLAGGRLISKEEYQAMLLANEAYELIKTEKYKMACEILKKALAVAPTLASVHTNLGLALTQLGSTDEAIDHLKQAIAIDPSRSAAWINLASAFQLSGQLKSALVTYSEYATRFPNEQLAKQANELAKHLSKEVKEQEVIASSPNAPDYFAFASHEGTVRWATQSPRLRVYFAPVSGIPTYKSEYDGFAADAFKQWSTASNDKVAFEFVKKPADADIEWIWTDDPTKVSSVAEGGETNVDYEGGKIKHATVTVLTKNPGIGSPLSANQIRAVSLHEIGHALGLIGHSPKPQDIMFCSMPPALARPTLSARDVNTIGKLYATTVSYARR